MRLEILHMCDLDDQMTELHTEKQYVVGRVAIVNTGKADRFFRAEHWRRQQRRARSCTRT